ncbi:oxidoreductase [Pseudonocardia humida]|uniref:SDR family NAD(P)-dependent oxidoreductase n=1 Tax=Pseudonocardia humida TaxID=2800819 RepID=A0ABT0ZZV5_9PSEU|nr:oxidoreductase [Pseudonocardia humida]MCO1656261.1 SDR family NAD(P)-dependent oxidoreductase [Pseudonocardia humida]
MSARIPDQTGRTAIITGGGSGIGRAAAAALAARGARVILAVRDQDKGRAAAAAMGGGAEVRPLDLASLASVREFARGVDEPVDLLINNAGAMTASLQRTADGFESQFGVNHLGHFALTNLLLDRVTARVVTVSSRAHRWAHIDFDDLGWHRRPYRPFAAYAQSKLANLLFTAELQRRLTAAGSPVIATAADPGWAATGFRIASGNRVLDTLSAIATRVLAHGPEAGALPTLLAAVGDVPGGSLAAPSRFGGVRGPATLVQRSAEAHDAGVAGRLWEAHRHPLPAASTSRSHVVKAATATRREALSPARARRPCRRGCCRA